MSIHNQISIIPNIQDISIEEISDSFTDFLPPSALIWIEDSDFIREKINNISFRQTKGRLRSDNGKERDCNDREQVH